MAGSLLSVADDALNAAQTALLVAAQNTANSNNPAYLAETAATTPGPVIGPIADTVAANTPTGVTVAGITVAADPVLDRVVGQQTSRTAYWTTLSAAQAGWQALFNEPQPGGLQEVLNQFGSAWTTLEDNPGSTAEAAAVVQSGQAVATTITTLQTQLAQQADALISQLQTQMATLATQSQAVAQANADAASLPAGSAGQATLANTVHQALVTLASTAAIQVLPTADGGATVTSGGVSLVSGTTAPPASAFQVQVTGTGPWYAQTVSLTIDGAAYTPTSGAIAGTLAALAQVQSAGQQLASVAQMLATGVPTGSTTPAAFFTATANGGLAVASGVTPAVVQARATGGALDTIQQAMTAWTQLVGDIGNTGAQGTAMAAQQQQDLAALQAQQQSVQGVNLNQAATATVQAQEAYQAAAQLVQVQQSLVATLLAAVG